jgi:ubiquinone/menaquinone biosynthesis C-methylase UbiE
MPDIDENKKVSQLWGAKARENLDGKNRELEWDSHPFTIAYINRKITGNADETWIDWFKKHYACKPFEKVLSLGSGSGGLERELVIQNIAQSIEAYDISLQALDLAKKEAEKCHFDTRISYHYADLNTYSFKNQESNACFAIAALHHIQNLEHLIEQIHNTLKPHGLFVINDYIGPNRFQWTDKAESITNKVLAILPDNLRTNLRDGVTIKGCINKPSVKEVITVDPSEAVRSEDILKQVAKKFNLLFRADYGGTLLQFLLADIIGNFKLDNPDHKTILELICLLEDTLLTEKILPGYFTFLVAQKK